MLRQKGNSRSTTMGCTRSSRKTSSSSCTSRRSSFSSSISSNRSILNQKRNFRKIHVGLRCGHTRYERKKKSTPTSNETEISNEINDFQTVHEL